VPIFATPIKAVTTIAAQVAVVPCCCHHVGVEKLAYSLAKDDGTVEASVAYRMTSPAPSPYYMGKGEIIREYDAGQTSRSREWNRDMDMGRGFASDRTVFDAQKLAELTVQKYPPTIPDKTGKLFSVVGGKVAVAKLTSNKIEWIERASCLAK
jgi:hypothetical protein